MAQQALGFSKREHKALTATEHCLSLLIRSARDFFARYLRDSPHKSERAISLAGSRPQLSDFRRPCSAPESQPIVPRGLLGARRPKPTPASLFRDHTGCTSLSVPSTRIQFPEYAVSTVSSSLKVRLCSLLGKISLPLV